MFGEMWISAAGASNSRRRLRGRLATPRQTWRGHDSTNSPLEALPRLSSLGGHANSALLPTGHGHPLSLASLFQLLLRPLPLYNTLHRLFDPASGIYMFALKAGR